MPRRESAKPRPRRRADASLLDAAMNALVTPAGEIGLIDTWSAAAAPPPMLTVSQWADEKRMLPETSGAKGARWRTDQVAYLRGVMDAVNEPGIRQIALMKAAQVGGSECLHNILGYFIEHDPCPMLFVHPAAEIAEEWSKERLADMIRSTPALSSVVKDKRMTRGSNDSESTLKLKMFPGGFLALGGANTPNTFARRAVRIAIGDDVDRFPPVVGEEGDPADLLVNRTTTFDDPLVLFVSTPTMKFGRIDTLFGRSDQRRYFVQCPVCGREDWITWSGACENVTCGKKHFFVSFDERDPETARLECPSEEHGGCGAFLFEPERRAMVLAGEWRATAKPLQVGLAGFHLPAMISTLGVTLPYLVDKFLTARAKGKESLRVFINTSLAQAWEDRGARMEPHALLAKREDYGEGIEVPAKAVVLTCGVDVQGDRFELQVVGWGPAGERWLVDWRAVMGDPRKAETRGELLQALSRRYVHATGHQLPIMATCIDTGYATDEMYEFVLAFQARRIFATKGYAGKSGEPIVGKHSEKRSGRSARPVRLYPINVDDAKSDILGALTVLEHGPGYMHFPLHLDSVNEEYFAQLCAEHKETKYNRGGVATHSVWVLDRDRNEALDTAVLALSALRLLNPNIKEMADLLAAASPPQSPNDDGGSGSPPPSSPPPSTAPPARRVSHSRYIGR